MLNFALLSAGVEGAAFDLSELLTSGVSTVQGDILTALGIVVPAIIHVTGMIVAVRFGIRWLKKLGKG